MEAGKMSIKLSSVLIVLSMWAGVGLYTFAQMLGWIDISMPYRAMQSPEDQSLAPRRK